MAVNSGKKIKRLTDQGSIVQALFADLAAALRVAESGLNWTPVGSITAAVRVDKNNPILVYNSTGGDLFVAFGDSSLAAPADATEGMPVLANSTAVLNSGDNVYVRASAGGLFAYVGDL